MQGVARSVAGVPHVVVAQHAAAELPVAVVAVVAVAAVALRLQPSRAPIA